MANVAATMAADHPLELLALTSTMLAVTDPRSEDPLTRAQGQGQATTVRQGLIDTIVEVDRPETTAVLVVMAELVDDDLLRRRLRRAIEGRDTRALPAWLDGLAPLTVGRTAAVTHILGDGDNVMIEASTASGHVLTAMVYIDHNVGTLAKDGSVIDRPLDDLVEMLLDAADDPDVTVEALDPADARARIDEAIDIAAMTVPPFETESWPASRALVEWIGRHLPPGGRGYVVPEWDDRDRRRLVERFLASPFGRAHKGRDDRDLADLLVSYACNHTPGDPLRWSGPAVELVLDWVPHKVMADPRFLSRVPTVLRSLVRYAHAERGIRPSLTEEVLTAVDRFEPAFLRDLATGVQGGADPLLALLGLTAEKTARDAASRAVGGEEALARLTDEPLPDEELDLTGVPADIEGTVLEVASLIDRGCAALLDLECRTAARRLLADVARADPEVFRRRGRTDTAAAAVTWIVAKANNRLGHDGDGLTATALARWFGVSGSPSQRASTLLKAIGIMAATGGYGLNLGTPRYLTSTRRRTIMDARS